MVEPKWRFKKDDGSSYPAWKEFALDDVLTERNEPHRITDDAPQLSFTIEQGVIYPEDKKTNKRDFLMKDKDNKKFLLTEYNDIIYNPANLKFGAIHRNALGRGVVSPIYAIFTTNQNPEFIEGIVTNPAFIKRSLKYLEGTVEKLKTLKPKDFVKMHVWIPCLEEQEKIADFLSSVDEVITISEEEVASLETQKKAVMKKIFSQEVRFKRTDGSDFPEWEEKALVDRCTFSRGQGMSWSSISENGSNEVVLYGNLYSEYGMRFDKITYRTNESKTGKVLSKKGDVLIPGSDTTPTGLARASCILVNDVILGGDINILRPLNDDGECLSYCINANRSKLIPLIKGSSVKHIQNKDIEKVSVSMPVSSKEQRLIADFLSDFDEAIAAAKKELELWKELKKGLLQQMFV